MRLEPHALEPGWRLADRFVIKRVLGQGGFGIAYLATDVLRDDLVVIKELAIQGTKRTPDGVLRFSEAEGNRLRDEFLEEARLLSRFNLKGVPPIRATFRENGTAYFATDYVPDTKTLQDLLDEVVRLSPSAALDIFFALMDILDSVHAKRILHRDIKPSNVLVAENGTVYLIDFGSAREWHADSTVSHNVQHTPGYAPPEQLSERARRGPATDIYSLCATLYAMLTGDAPPSAPDRASGTPLPALLSIRSDLEPLVVQAIEAGLSLPYADRPQTVAALRDFLAGDMDTPKQDNLEILDETLLRLKRFSYERRACPACKGLLVEPKPLRRNVCPVCQGGIIRMREIHERLCPVCHLGALSPVKNAAPLAFCPTCRMGILTYRRKSLVSLDQIANCNNCQAKFETRAGKMASLDGEGDFRSYDEWRSLSGRSSEVWKCPDCPAQFDLLPDGRWEHMTYKPGSPYRTLYPEEWARVAIGLEPGAGNAQCDACDADFYLEKQKLTLLDAKEDPFGFADAYLGRLLSLEDARWLGARKTSPHPGFVCDQCHTEFDKDHQYLRLVATSNHQLSRFIDQPKIVEDWHRIAQQLPTIHEEAAFEESLDDALNDAYRTGKISFDEAGTVLWKGEAARTGEGRASTLLVTTYEIVFGGLLWKRRQPTDAVVGVWADDQELHIQFSGEREQVGYRVTPMELVAHLASGDRKIPLTARDLAARMTSELQIT